uniref:G_PROTEIN_RECEP_F1_2 domain-containing protein n=1 Tax=Heligmosomoides polygyrus TaxID=6339 RepID=A0A183FMD7_HELPZ
LLSTKLIVSYLFIYFILIYLFSITNTSHFRGVFSDATCQIYGGIDMALSLSQVVLATIIAFDRYIVTIAPKWGKWRSHSNYFKLIICLTVFATLWSAVPVTGYGKYSTFHGNTLCSLDWRQGDFDAKSQESADAAHHYIAFLTATCLIFFLIPVCIASSFYYSIIDHVDRLALQSVSFVGPLPED